MTFCKISLTLLIPALIVFNGTVMAEEEDRGNRSTHDAAAEYQIRLLFDGKEAVVRLRDHPTTRDLISRLPMTLPFQDYMDKEKIAHLPNKLSCDGSSPTNNGDFAYYAPWGNIAIFYRGAGNAGGGLVIMGSLESGKSDLAAMTDDFIMTLEMFGMQSTY